MRHGKRYLSLLLALLWLLSLLACAQQPEQEQQESLSLRLAYVQTPETLDPAMVTSGIERTLVSHLFENLMQLSADGVQSGAARSYVCTDNLDGTETYTFSLREGLQWSDGTALTAHDFVYAWRRLVSPDTASPNREILNVVSGYEQAAYGDPEALQVTAEDAQTLVVQLNCHCPYFLTEICCDASTMPVRKDLVQKGIWAANGGPFCTNGIYRLKTWTAEQIVLEKDEKFDLIPVAPASLTFLFTETASRALQLYKGGQADFVMNIGNFENAVKIFCPDSTYLIVNQMAENLKSQSLRQAMNLVIDRNEVAKIMGNGYVAAKGLVPEGVHISNGYVHFRGSNGILVDNDQEHYEDNCAKAQELLKEAGYSRKELNALGNITLLCQNSTSQQYLAQYIQKTWQDKLFLTVTVMGVSEDQWQECLQNGEFSLALLTTIPRGSDAMEYLKDFATGETKNYGLYSNTAYDLLMRTAAQSGSPEARDAYLEDAERLLLESGYVMPLCGRETAYLLRPELTGVFDNGLNQCYFTNITTVSEGMP